MHEKRYSKPLQELNRTVLIEGAIILLFGLISFVEGIRLTYMERLQLYDVLGPGRYNAAVGVLLMIAGSVYILSQRYRDDSSDYKIRNMDLRRKMISMIAILAAYIFLMGIIGYFGATLFFFFLTFRIVGFRSWSIIGGASLAVSISLYLLFVEFANTAFPRGYLIDLIFR